MFIIAAIELELYYKLTPMYKYYWYWTNQCLVNKQCKIQKNWNNDLFKVSQHNVNAKETKPMTRATDIKQSGFWLANKAGNKQLEQWPFKSQQPMYYSHANETTPMVYADDTGQINM